MIVAVMPAVGVTVLFSTHVGYIVHPDMMSRSSGPAPVICEWQLSTQSGHFIDA